MILCLRISGQEISLEFTDLKSLPEKITGNLAKTDITDSIRVAVGKVAV